MGRFTGLSIKSKSIFIMMLLLLLPIGPVLAQHDGRYFFKYPGSFFNYGGEEVEFNVSVHRKIGVLVSNRTTRPLSEITRIIFNTSPFGRYKQFFYFRMKRNFVSIWQAIISFPPELMIMTAGQ